MKKTLLLMLFFILPPLILILYIFSGTWKYPALFPQTWSLRIGNFIIRNGKEILISLSSSLLYSSASVFLSLLLCLLPASLLARREFKGRTLIEALLLSPVLIPAITFSMGIHWIFIKTGLSDSLLGVSLILTLFSYPYMLRALTSGFMMYDPRIDQCAENLGAGPVRRTLFIHLPLIIPSIISGGTVVFLSSFSSYFLVFLIGGGAVPSFTGYLVPFLKSGDKNISSFLSLLFLLIPLCLFYITDRATGRFQIEKVY